MTKVLLKRVGRLTKEQYDTEVAKIARITVAEQAKRNPFIEIHSYSDLVQSHLKSHPSESGKTIIRG